MNIIDYAKKVQYVRSLQKSYFTSVKKDPINRHKYLDMCKKAEKELDQITEEILTIKQPSLFNEE